ncbi:MAG: ATP synthase F1 subunit delta [Bdellovibrionia bacterium]
MSIAHSYAHALYYAFEGTNQLSQIQDVETRLGQLVSVLRSSAEACVALMSPLSTLKEKSEVIDDLAKKLNLSFLETRFFHLLVKKGRLSLLPDMVQAFHAFRLEKEGSISGQLVVAEPISAEEMDSLSSALSKKFGKKVLFQVSLDPSLLAGLKVTVNGVTYDGTLRSQLQKLRDRFVTGLPGSYA